MKVETLFDVGDKVIIDGDKSIVAVVTVIHIQGPNFFTYQVGYFHNGTMSDIILDEWRLDKWEG